MCDFTSPRDRGSLLSARAGVNASRTSTVCAPYRICPLGAHIDHQLGQVTAMALNQGVMLEFAPLDLPEVRMLSADYPGEIQFPFSAVPERPVGDWGDYLRGAVRALQQRYNLQTGLVGMTAGRVAEGGLSSSAAVGVAYLLALEHVNHLHVEPATNIVLDQFIENDYLGLRNGVLDQSAILLSRKDHLTSIDCRTLEHELVPAAPSAPNFVILIAFSGVRQTLVETHYNRRVDECAQAARVLLHAAGRRPVEPLLGNVSSDEYRTFQDVLTGAAARRAEHFFSEMVRVREGIDAWRRGDLCEFGRLITASGASSIRNYECGAPPLVDLYELLVQAQGVYGARFSGAGFRGCCLALVDPDHAQAVTEDVQERYAQIHPELAEHAHFFFADTADAATVWP